MNNAITHIIIQTANAEMVGHHLSSATLSQQFLKYGQNKRIEGLQWRQPGKKGD